jgi:hypothetical protein
VPKNATGHQFAVNQVTIEDRLKTRIAEIHNDVVDLPAELWRCYERAEESMELVAGRQIGNRHDRKLVEGFNDELDAAGKLRVRGTFGNRLRTNAENYGQGEGTDGQVTNYSIHR